ncbi:MAG: DUF3187 family protein [Proteobacteria bacterium]|nr:MAG: DUF3187 family protein [Pseudomonadota bacterium]
MKNLLAYGLILTSYFTNLPVALAEASDYVPEPLLLRSEALGQLFRSSPYAQRIRLGEEGAARLSFSRTYANFWGRDKRYIVDAETRDDAFRFHYQPSPLFELYGAFSERGFTQSGTDTVAIKFHDFFGLGQDGRLDAPRHNTRIAIPDFDMNYNLSSVKEVLSRQIEAGVVWDLNKSFDLGINSSLAFFTTYETARGNPYYTYAIDGGAKLSASQSWGNFAVFGSLSLGVFDQRQEVSIASYEQQWGLGFGSSYRFFDNHEVILQSLTYQPLFQKMGQLSRESYEIHAAYRYTYEKVQLEIGLIENIFWVYNSPDWGVSAGLTYHFAN